MAKVIDMRVYRLFVQREVRERPMTPAEIVIFPGVRYTYHDSGRLHGCGRDVLELAE